MNNNLNFQFSMYESTTNSTIINNGNNNFVLIIRYKECNFSVTFDDPNNTEYLYRLARKSPLLYAKLTLIENRLQDYTDAMNELN